MSVSFGIVVGFVAWFVVRYLLAGLYTVDQNERAVKTELRARASGSATRPRSTIPIAEDLRPDERARYTLSAGARDSAGRPVLQVAVGEGPQGLDRHAAP